MKSMDMFRKVPGDLTSSTLSGGVLSVAAVATMALMMLVEVWVFLKHEPLQTKIDVDVGGASTPLRINFNLTFPHLHCDFASIDLWDKIGKNVANVSKNIERWQLDEFGHRRMYQGRNRREYDIEHDYHHPPLHEMYEDGIHVEPIGEKDWDEFSAENEFSFVNFYAPWCAFCQHFHSTWEALAEEVEESEIDVAIASVDCVEHAQLCHDRNVGAFPTLIFFRHGVQVNHGEYRWDRTVDAMMQFIEKTLDTESIYKQYPEAQIAHKTNWNSDHPGCLVSGFLTVNKVPGNFHVEAHSRHHSLNTFKTNLSHTINHLSFGSPLNAWQKNRLDDLDLKYHLTNPLDGRSFHHKDSHHAFHHYIQVVPTRYRLGSYWREKFATYQMVHAAHLMPYRFYQPPTAVFAFDLSPMAVVVDRVEQRWYDFATNLLAVLGGTFAMARFGSDIVARLT